MAGMFMTLTMKITTNVNGEKNDPRKAPTDTSGYNPS